jgi:hypothetical protein
MKSKKTLNYDQTMMSNTSINDISRTNGNNTSYIGGRTSSMTGGNEKPEPN